MRQLVESLKRLFNNSKIDKEKIVERYEKKVITEEEMNYILNKK